MSGLVGNPFLLTSAGAGGYQISRSLRFNSSDSAYCDRSFTSAGNRKTWTFAAWVKLSALTGSNSSGGGTLFHCRNGTGDDGITDFLINTDGTVVFTGGASTWLTTTQVLRDFSAWYHLVMSVDTTAATASNRLRLYINGSQVTTFNVNVSPTQNSDLAISQAATHRIGGRPSFSQFFNGYLADIHFIDGQALTPSSFAETNATTGQWVPKAYTGSYGTNGFRLDFSDNSAATATTLGKDAAGSNNWTPNNFSVLTGSAVPIASATGGQPIHNTTDTFGATIGTGVRADANASTLVLAAPLTTAGSNNLSDDESPTGRTSSIKTLTANGSITSSTSVSRYYGGAALFASGGYYALSGSDFTFGTGDFTIEAWVYNPSTTEGSLFATHPNAFATTNFNSRFYGSLQRIDIYTSGAGDYMSITGIPVDQWIHIAMCRSGGTTMRLFVNGTLRGTSNGWGMSLSDSQFFINGGRDGSGARYYQDVRVYKGLAKYSSNFVVPNAAPNPTLGAGNDSLVDTPTSYGTDTGAGGEVRGNYCTWNSLSNNSGTLTNGNLDLQAVSGNADTRTNATIGVSSGKWYYEITLESAATNSSAGFGQNNITNAWPGNDAKSYAYELDNARTANNGTLTAYGSALTSGDVFMCALDLDNNKIFFGKNGTWFNSSNPSTGASPAFTVSAGTYSPIGRPYGNLSAKFNANFGQRPFAYTAPSGFKALCDTNLPAPVVAKPSTVMDVVLYNGNSSNQSITSLGFSPDLVWGKSRNTNYFNTLQDTVRGAGQKILYSNSTDAENAYSQSWIDSFDSNGFTMPTGFYNQSGYTYVAWCWDAGSSTVTNTQGSITSQVRANASAGFSIVTYTGTGANATVGHGLGVTPSFIIVKSRSNTTDWQGYHGALGKDYTIQLMSTGAAINVSNYWNGGVSSTTFGINGAYDGINANGYTYVAYCFSPVAGYSSAFSYSGSGSSDGPAVWLGFRPRLILIKRSDSTASWQLYDTARGTYNVVTQTLAANESTAESGFTSGYDLDILSTGFKIRAATSNAINSSGGTYIGFAWAESPFQYARAR